MLSGLSVAEEINSPPPVDLLLLQHKKVLEGEPLIGAYGSKKYCYRLNNMYVLYTENLLGEGYSFLKDKPDQKCISSKNKISTKNNLGLTVGISKQQASELLGETLVEGNNKTVWHYQRKINNFPYDDITVLNVTIKNGLVYAVRLFTTVTS